MIIAKYGKALTFSAPIPKVGLTDFAATGDWTPVAGDVKISKNDGNVANIATLPVAIGGTGSVLWKWSLSATEMQARTITIQVVDAAVENQAFTILTVDHPDAHDPRGITEGGTAQAGAASTITLRSGATATNDIYQGQICYITAGTGKGQSRPIISYVGSTKVATISGSWPVTPDNTSVYELKPDAVTEITVPSAADNANATYDLDISSKTVTNTAGKKLNDVAADTADIQPKIGTPGLGTLAAHLPTSLSAGGYMKAAVITMNGKIITGDGTASIPFAGGAAE